MDKEALKNLLNGFDLGALVPHVEDILSIVAPTAKVLMLLGPFVMLAFGLYCLMIAPKEATYAAGYRFRWGMASPESWRFMQRLAGVVFSVLGMLSAIYMALFTRHLADLELMDLLTQSCMYILLQAGLALAGCVITNFLVIFRYDRKGVRRYTWRELFSE